MLRMLQFQAVKARTRSLLMSVRKVQRRIVAGNRPAWRNESSPIASGPMESVPAQSDAARNITNNYRKYRLLIYIESIGCTWLQSCLKASSARRNINLGNWPTREHAAQFFRSAAHVKQRNSIYRLVDRLFPRRSGIGARCLAGSDHAPSMAALLCSAAHANRNSREALFPGSCAAHRNSHQRGN